MSIVVNSLNSNCREELNKSINTGSYPLGDMVAITANSNFSIVPGVSSPALTKYYNKYIITVSTVNLVFMTLPAISQVANNAVKNGFSVYIRYNNTVNTNQLIILNSSATIVARLYTGFAVNMIANASNNTWTITHELAAGSNNEILVSSNNSPVFSNTINPANVNITNNLSVGGKITAAGGASGNNDVLITDAVGNQQWNKLPLVNIESPGPGPERIIFVDNSGVLSYVNKNYLLSYKNTGPFNMVNSVNPITFDTLISNINSPFTYNAGLFTCAVDGTYKVSLAAILNINNSTVVNYDISPRKNNNTISLFKLEGTNNINCSFTILDIFTVGDILDIATFRNTPGPSTSTLLDGYQVIIERV